MSGRRRRFGAVRKLSSGRYQARYLAGDGCMHSAPSTFATRDDADQFLAVVETDLLRGCWFDTTAGNVRLDIYAPRWIVERPVELQPRVSGATTRELMHRLGHSSSRAALIYQHATEDRNLAIVEAMSRLVARTSLPPRPQRVTADG